MSSTRQAERPTRPASLSWSAATQGAAWRFFAMYWASVLVVGMARPGGRVITMSALAVLGVLCSLRQRILVGVGLGLVGWLFVTGFVANPSGTLALHGPADAVRLVLLTALAGLAAYLTGPRLPHRLDSWRGRW